MGRGGRSGQRDGARDPGQGRAGRRGGVGRDQRPRRRVEPGRQVGEFGLDAGPGLGNLLIDPTARTAGQPGRLRVNSHAPRPPPPPPQGQGGRAPRPQPSRATASPATPPLPIPEERTSNRRGGMMPHWIHGRSLSSRHGGQGKPPPKKTTFFRRGVGRGEGGERGGERGQGVVNESGRVGSSRVELDRLASARVPLRLLPQPEGRGVTHPRRVRSVWTRLAARLRGWWAAGHAMFGRIWPSLTEADSVV